MRYDCYDDSMPGFPYEIKSSSPENSAKLYASWLYECGDQRRRKEITVEYKIGGAKHVDKFVVISEPGIIFIAIEVPE